MRRILVVAAHPDDEALGCGGTIAKHTAAGDRVEIVFIADGVSSRGHPIDSRHKDRRREAANQSSEILGARQPRYLEFPDNALDAVPLLEIIQAIERIVSKVAPEIIYTHHGGDLNIDHRRAFQAVLTACRPLPGHSVQTIYSFEVLSSSEWGDVAISIPFEPNCFIDITKELGVKLEALKIYSEELRSFPHPRSLEAVRALAKLRGAASGLQAAEGLRLVRQKILRLH